MSSILQGITQFLIKVTSDDLARQLLIHILQIREAQRLYMTCLRSQRWQAVNWLIVGSYCLLNRWIQDRGGIWVWNDLTPKRRSHKAFHSVHWRFRIPWALPLRKVSLIPVLPRTELLCAYFVHIDHWPLLWGGTSCRDWLLGKRMVLKYNTTPFEGSLVAAHLWWKQRIEVKSFVMTPASKKEELQCRS